MSERLSAESVRRIYCVSSGAYSDYRVLCACPTKKDAKAVAAKLKTDEDGWRTDARVEEFEMVTADVEKVEILMLSTTLWDDGTETHTSERIRSDWPFDTTFDDGIPMTWRWVRAPMHKNQGGRLDVSGTDFELVRKTYSDKRAQLIAEDAFRRKGEAKGRVTKQRQFDGTGATK